MVGTAGNIGAPKAGAPMAALRHRWQMAGGLPVRWRQLAKSGKEGYERHNKNNKKQYNHLTIFWTVSRQLPGFNCAALRLRFPTHLGCLFRRTWPPLCCSVAASQRAAAALGQSAVDRFSLPVSKHAFFVVLVCSSTGGGVATTASDSQSLHALCATSYGNGSCSPTSARWH